MTTTKNLNLRKKAYAAVTSLLLASASSVIYNPPAQAAGTPEGTIIGNQATATYKDAGNNDFTSTSNLVTTTITAVYSFVLTPNSTVQTSDVNAQANPGQSQNSTAGNIVYFPYTLTNNSNTTDSYDLVMIKGSDSNVDPQNVELYIDANGNGFIDVGDSLIANGLGSVTPNGAGSEDDTTLFTTNSGTVSNIVADGQVKLIVKYQVPVTAASNDVINLDLRARSRSSATSGTAQPDGDAQDTNNLIDSRNYSKVTVVNDAVVAVTKAVDKATANPGDQLEYTFTVTNTGNKDAKNIRLVDLVPKNTVDGRLTDFVVGSATSTDGSFSYTSDSNLTNATAAAATYGYTPSGTEDSNVTAIKYDLATLAPGNTRTIKFKVKIRSVLSQAKAGLIPNNAPYAYDTQATYTGVGDTTPNVETITNTVNTDINKKAAVLISFDGSPFSPQTTGGTDGALTDTTTQASAPANSYVYYKQVVTNTGNAPDAFNITTASNTFPAGSSVTYFQQTDASVPGNNTSPLLDTTSDSLIDTGTIAAGASKTIIARVFIPATVSVAGPYTATVQAASTNGGSAVGTGAGNILTDTTRDVVTAIQAPSVNLENYIDSGTTERGYAEPKNDNISVTANASANGTTVSYPVTVQNRGGAIDSFNLDGSVSGTLLTAGATLAYYPIITKNTVGTAASAGATSVILQDATGFSIGDKIVINGQTLTIGGVSGSTITFAAGQSLYEAASVGETAVEPGTTAITSTNPIAAASQITTLAAVAAQGATSVTLTSTVGLSVGDIIKIATAGGDEYFTIASVNSGTGVVQFVSGQAIADAGGAANGATVSEVNYQSVLAVVTVPANTNPITGTPLNVNLTTTSTNDGTKSDQVTNNLLIPDFRDFTLVANRSGSAAAGTVLFYDHVLTNTGNSDGTFNLSIATDGSSPDFVYQLLDSNNNAIAVTANVSGNVTTLTTTTPISVTKASPIYNFKVKVTIPAGTAPSTVDTITVSAAQTGGSTKTNTDITTVVAGFIQLTKTVANKGQAGTTTASGATAIPGDILEYVINYENVGADTAYQVKLTDLIPANTTYVNGSMMFDPDGTSGVAAPVARTDVAGVTESGDASADYNVSTPNGVTFFVGSGQAHNLGGNVPSGGKGAIIFRVKVN